MDIVAPIVFPDYLITVEQPAMEFEVPDLIPKYDVFPKHVRIPGRKFSVPELGHAGVLFMDGSNGTTKYYEYGRYDREALGLTRRVPVSDCRIGRDGKPTEASLARVLAQISAKAGHGGRIESAYIELRRGAYAAMLQFAQKWVTANQNKNRRPYELMGNNCMTFAKDLAAAGGAKMPTIYDPRPNSFIHEVQALHTPMRFTPPDQLKIGR